MGRKLVPIDCGPGHSTEPALLAVMEESRAQLENNDLYNFMEMVQGHWLFQAITLVILAIVAREAVVELVPVDQDAVAGRQGTLNLGNARYPVR